MIEKEEIKQFIEALEKERDKNFKKIIKLETRLCELNESQKQLLYTLKGLKSKIKEK